MRSSRLPPLLLALLAPPTALFAQQRDPVPAAEPPTARERIRQTLGIEFSVTLSKIRRSIVRTSTPFGFAVRSVAVDSLAAQAGLTAGVVVLSVDGKPIRELADLATALQAAQPGQQLVLACQRRKANPRRGDRQPWEAVTIAITLPGAAPK